MNKQDLITAVMAKTGCTTAEANRAVSAIVDTMTAALAGDDTVQLPGFGILEVRTRAERSGRNPSTGEMMIIPAKKAVVFKAAKALREKING